MRRGSRLVSRATTNHPPWVSILIFQQLTQGTRLVSHELFAAFDDCAGSLDGHPATAWYCYSGQRNSPDSFPAIAFGTPAFDADGIHPGRRLFDRSGADSPDKSTGRNSDIAIAEKA